MNIFIRIEVSWQTILKLSIYPLINDFHMLIYIIYILNIRILRTHM